MSKPTSRYELPVGARMAQRLVNVPPFISSGGGILPLRLPKSPEQAPSYIVLPDTLKRAFDEYGRLTRRRGIEHGSVIGWHLKDQSFFQMDAEGGIGVPPGHVVPRRQTSYPRIPDQNTYFIVGTFHTHPESDANGGTAFSEMDLINFTEGARTVMSQWGERLWAFLGGGGRYYAMLRTEQSGLSSKVKHGAFSKSQLARHYGNLAREYHDDERGSKSAAWIAAWDKVSIQIARDFNLAYYRGKRRLARAYP